MRGGEGRGSPGAGAGGKRARGLSVGKDIEPVSDAICPEVLPQFRTDAAVPTRDLDNKDLPLLRQWSMMRHETGGPDGCLAMEKLHQTGRLRIRTGRLHTLYRQDGVHLKACHIHDEVPQYHVCVTI